MRALRSMSRSMARPLPSMPMGKPIGIGLHGRTGVALTGVGDDLGLLARTEVRTRESQPFHDAQAMALADAERWIARAEDEAIERATADLRALVDELAGRGLQVVAAGVAGKAYRLPSSLGATLRSHPLCHAAEGKMTNDALVAAGTALGLEVVVLTDGAIADRVETVGKLVGPPWRKEHKLAATAALAALGRR